MTWWQAGALIGLGGWVAATLHNIFVEVRAIRRMMNADRKIPNELND